LNIDTNPPAFKRTSTDCECEQATIGRAESPINRTRTNLYGNDELSPARNPVFRIESRRELTAIPSIGSDFLPSREGARHQAVRLAIRS
jgi:hypothetical protein